MEEIQQGRFHRGQGNAFRKGHRRACASELCGVSAKERANGSDNEAVGLGEGKNSAIFILRGG